MPKKLSSAVVGTLAVGLTLPASVAAAHAADTPINDGPPQQLTGSGHTAPAADLASGVNISTGSTAGTFSDPLAEQSYTFSTGKGPRCMSMQGASAHHQGQDLVTAEGTPITAISDGTVVRTVDGTASRAGFIVVRHNIGGQVYHSGYLHVWDAESHVSVGDSVSAGDTVGVVGDSGPTLTPHLHLEIWQGGWHTGTALDPTAWLAERGVDLQDNAQRVQQRETPSSCDYYTAQSTKLLASASPNAEVLAQLDYGAELTSAPGDAADGFVRVTAGEHTGWVRHGHITPDRPVKSSAGSSGTAPAGSSSSAAGKHRVTEPLYARSGPGTNHDIRQGMPTGELITVTATSGDWVQFTRRGEQVWSHGAYLESADESHSSGQSTSASEAGASQPAEDSGAQTHEVTTALNLRSGPGDAHGVVGGMPAGERVSVVSTDGEWMQIRRSNGQQGWSYGAYLSDGSSADSSGAGSQTSSAEGSSSAASESASAGSGSSGSESGASEALEQPSSSAASDPSDEDAAEAPTASHRVDGVYLNARSGAGMDQAVVTVLDPGTGVQVTGRSGEWASFERDGNTLWVHAEHLRGAQDDAEASSADSASETSSSESSSDSEGSGSPSSDSSSGASGAAESGSGASNSGTPESDSSDSSGSSDWGSSGSGSSGSGSADAGASVSDASDPDAAANDAPASDTDAVRTTEWVNMRSGAGMDHSVQRTVAPHTEIDVQGRSGGWYQVHVGDSTGWIWHEYLDLPASESASTPPADSSASSQESSSQDSDSSSNSSESSNSSGASNSESSNSSGSSSAESSQSSGRSVDVISGVNMRSGAGMDHDVMQVVHSGVSVDVLDKQGGWYQVRTDGNTGWIWREYLDVSDGGAEPAGGTSAPEESESEESDSSGSGSSSSGSSSSGSSTGSSEASSGSGSSSSSSSGSSSSGSSSSGSSSSGSSSSGSGGSGSGGSSGRTGPSSGQHAQSSHGPYSAVWDRLAQCESGGNWSINTGNGYYGGVQFSAQSWQAVGGSGLPSDASKQEQIERAHALWQQQGWNAWPACSARLGLSGDPGGWGDSYFDVHGGTQSASAFAAEGQWTAGYSVPLREAPSVDSERLVQIPRGAVLDAGERSGSWLQVEVTHDGERLTGWVNTRFITVA